MINNRILMINNKILMINNKMLKINNFQKIQIIKKKLIKLTRILYKMITIFLINHFKNKKEKLLYQKLIQMSNQRKN